MVVSVADMNGVKLTDFALAYTLNGEAKTEFCLGYYCGPHPIEVTGEFTVTASLEGYRSETVAVTVGRDVCHVITEQVSIVLRPSS